MKIQKAESRDKKFHKGKHGMRVSNKSIFIFNGLWTGKKKRGKK